MSPWAWAFATCWKTYRAIMSARLWIWGRVWNLLRKSNVLNKDPSLEVQKSHCVNVLRVHDVRFRSRARGDLCGTKLQLGPVDALRHAQNSHFSSGKANVTIGCYKRQPSAFTFAITSHHRMHFINHSLHGKFLASPTTAHTRHPPLFSYHFLAIAAPRTQVPRTVFIP
jgi:hypothetical protein